MRELALAEVVLPAGWAVRQRFSSRQVTARRTRPEATMEER